jgi:hypothetical protein
MGAEPTGNLPATNHKDTHMQLGNDRHANPKTLTAGRHTNTRVQWSSSDQMQRLASQHKPEQAGKRRG